MPKNFNVKLYTARMQKLWTVEEAAEAAQIHPLSYRRWESGKQKPHVSSLRLLCEAFNKTPAELGF